MTLFSQASRLLDFCLKHTMCINAIVESFATPKWATLFVDIHVRLSLVEEPFFQFVSTLFGLVDQTKVIRQERELVGLVQGWMLMAAVFAGPASGSFTGKNKTLLESQSKRFLGIAEEIFRSLTDAGRDACRLYWAENLSTQQDRNPVCTFVVAELTNFRVASDPLSLMKQHLKHARHSYWGSPEIPARSFLNACPDLASELIELWIEANGQPKELTEKAIDANKDIFLAATSCAYPVHPHLKSKLLEIWLGLIIGASRIPHNAYQYRELVDLTKRLFLSLPPLEQCKAAKIWAASLSEPRSTRCDSSNPLDEMFISWYKRTM
jgi:hypothetical protein